MKAIVDRYYCSYCTLLSFGQNTETGISVLLTKYNLIGSKSARLKHIRE